MAWYCIDCGSKKRTGGGERCAPCAARNNPRRKLEDKFWEGVDKRGENECWEWQKARYAHGYGHIGHNGFGLAAHRVSWELHNGPIPDGMNVLHRCDNPPCVNPRHLFLGTQADNNRDMARKQRGNFFGERHPMAKLTKRDVLEIRQRYALGNVTTYQLAEEYGVRDSMISRIVSGKNWTHIDGPLRLGGMIGENNPNAKLTNEQAIEIRQRYAAGGIRHIDLARKYGVSRTTISHIVNLKKYASV